MLKLIVFDWDGTLADSVGKIIDCKKFLARKYNLPEPSEETIKNVLGTKFEHAFAICFPSISQEKLHELSKEFHALMQHDSYQATLFPNARKILELLKKRGVKIAIASAKNSDELSKAVIFNDLSGLLDVVCSSDKHQGKPFPEMLKYIMAQFKVRPEECLMIGDTTTDIIFGNNAGVKTIGVTFGAHDEEKLQTMKPYTLINEWMQLVGVIDEL